MAMSRPIQHNAPAGQMYSSIRDAGEQTLLKYCQGFPQSRESFILPILFKSAHPENVDQNDPNLSESDKRSLKGLNINIRGERGEYEVYKIFYTLIRQSPTETILVLHGYNLDNDNGRNLKKHALMKELPTIDLSGVKMKMEHDFVVIVQYIGIVLCEVKTSASAENIASAESQLHNSETFVNQILTAIAGPTSPQLPVVKVIFVPDEQCTPSAPSKRNDCYLIYKEDLENFTPKWIEIVNELKIKAQACFISPNCCVTSMFLQHLCVFESLTQYLVGVWLMKPLTKKTYEFETALSSDATTIDSAVNKAEFAPTNQAKKLTTDIATSMNEIFQKVDDFNITYLSPKQKSLYDNYKHALIHSHAGTGKTMLIVFKIIELLEADPSQKALLIAPEPHHLRLQQILNKHNITADIVTEFPYAEQLGYRIISFFRSRPDPSLLTCDVLIITLQNFFEVPRQTLMEYDVSMFNVFVDDMHCYQVPRSLLDICTFTDIGDFIDKTHKLLNAAHQYAWFAVDVVQQGWTYKYENQRSDQLFLTSDGSPRTFVIPVVTMTNVLRSTKEIADVLDSARQVQIKNTALDTKHVISDIGCGHHITTGTRVLYEKLEENTDKKHWVPFVCDRVCALLHNLTTATSQQPNHFPFATVALLFEDDHDLQKYKPSLQSMIKQQFNVGVQSIEEQLVNSNNDDVIIDHSGNVQSFESPTVVYVREWGESSNRALYNSARTVVYARTWGDNGGNAAVYNLLSRARTQCVVVDVTTNWPPLKLQHVDVIIWKEENGIFQKV